MPMPSRSDGIAVTTRKIHDHLIPAARMETGGMAKENRRLPAGPFPEGDLDSIHLELVFDGHS